MKNKKHFLNSKNIYIGLVVFIMVVFALGAAVAQPLKPSLQQGLISKLIEIKYNSELYLGSALKQGVDKDSSLANYNTLRWKLDGFVYQLSADMIAANSPRKMILLNAWCLEETHEKKSIQVYLNALREIEYIYQNQILPSLYRSDKTINLTTNVFYLLKDSYTIVNAISDIKTQKTMALIELLDHTRLLSPGELAKQVK